MVYLLLITFPIVMSASSFLLRKQTRLIIITAIATALAQIALVTQLPIDEPARMLGLTLTLDPLGRLFLLAFLCIGALSFLVTWWLPHGENFVPITLLILGMIVGAIVGW
jgi:formate hydrogenlyase subunit 3/multisubunit Na+/H+ antiporter MnhD subunit